MPLQALQQLRRNYHNIKQALPWFDAAIHKKDKADFPAYAADLPGNVEIAHFGSYKEMKIILHTEMDFTEIERLAFENPKQNIIIESGDRKLIYHYDKILHALQNFPNIYLCSYNFCNWLGHEQLVELKLGNRLLYGSHSPKYSNDAAMGPIIMGDFPWKVKCDIAGNNLRRLMGHEEIEVPEVALDIPAPFLIDAHAHNQQPGRKQVNGFPTPDMDFELTDWLEFMKKYACEKIFLVPSEALFFDRSAKLLTQGLRRLALERFFYFALFNPNLISDEYLLRLKRTLGNPGCIGIKIHPSIHKIKADDDKYEIIFQLAEELKKPLMTHSWDISDYNPVQYMSHPGRFRRYLKLYRKTPFILAHAGGRPGAFDATVQICKDFPNAYVDFAGDYYHNGVIEAFADKIGPDKILFGSDVNWFDPRCNLGMFLGASLPDEDILKMLRTNAEKIYLSKS